jgi:YD repeat-containing protein
MKKYLLLVFVFCLSVSAFSQAELKKITPLSPDAAAIVKYGETPVSYFTGVPNINFPMYTIKSRELSLPISLSYHAGGHKVEDKASWVGLGWSLGSIPSISRSVRGTPDDDGLGFFNLYGGKTVTQIYDNRYGSSADQALYLSFMSEVRAGVADSEPDIFSYTLVGKSGKFYYNQATQTFYTIPYDNTKIERLTNGFRITADDGVIHDFTVREFSTQGSGQTVNTWWVSKVVNANHTDSLLFDYTIMTETIALNTSVSKNIYLNGGTQCNFPQYESSQSVPTIFAVKPETVSFATGYLKFIPQTTDRADLPTSKALDKLQIFNYRNELIKQYKFNYSYYNSRLLLDSVHEQDPSGVSLKPHVFAYRTDISLQNTNGQDHWGFYNGINTNNDLIPTILYPLGYTYKSLLPGADRNVYPQYTQFSLLQQVTYPTGGSTTYEFEQNEVADTMLPVQTKDTAVFLTGNGSSQGINAVYEKAFTMDMPPDAHLNDNQGGAYVKIRVSNLGCDLSGGANDCANVYLTDLNGTPVTSSFTENLDGFYLPNGSYKMKAEFYQDPEQYQYFTFGILWQKPDSAYTGKHFVGGVRIKKITDYDGFDHANDKVRTFTYTQNDDSQLSSGTVFGLPYLNYTETYTYYCSNSMGDGCTYGYANLLRRSSYSNVTAVSHSGSFVGYTRVRVDYGSVGQNGRSVYHFSSEMDIQNNYFPYPPAVSREQRRGLLKESTDYKKVGSAYYPVQKTVNHYTTWVPFFAPGVNSSLASALKIATKDVVVDVCSQIPIQAEQIIYPYTLQSDWTGLERSEAITYDSQDTLKKAVVLTKYDYNGNYLQVKEVKTYLSNGDSALSIPKYPYDLTLAGISETARQKLISQNRLATALQQIKKINGVQKQLLQTNYKEFAIGKVNPHEVEVQVEAFTKEPRVLFTAYDNVGNLVEQQKTGDVKQCYLWGYNKSYPVAEVIGSDYATVSALVDQSILDNPPDEVTLRNHLGNLRNIPNCLVTTYTYQPLVGITSSTDARGVTTYYEYDGFGRLKLIKDQNGNIIKKYEYKYASQ